MKFISTLVFVSIFFSADSQPWKITGGYSFAAPQQEMASNIQPAHSLQAGAFYQLPKVKQLSVGLELGFGSYASKRIDQTFQFDNNTASVVPVNYSSNTFNVDLQSKFNLVSDKKNFIPYIDLKGGLYNFFSTINIDDPNDAGGCHALEQKTLINDKTLYWSAGTGVQINTGIFSKNKHKENVLIDLGANLIRGGMMDYINTKHLADAQTVNDGEGKPLQVQFINVSSQQIHEHTVAQLYTSALKMIEFRAGIVVGLD